MIETTIDNYDKWIIEGFEADTERRSKMCNEEKTRVAKVSRKEQIEKLKTKASALKN